MAVPSEAQTPAYRYSGGRERHRAAARSGSAAPRQAVSGQTQGGGAPCNLLAGRSGRGKGRFSSHNSLDVLFHGLDVLFHGGRPRRGHGDGRGRRTLFSLASWRACCRPGTVCRKHGRGLPFKVQCEGTRYAVRQRGRRMWRATVREGFQVESGCFCAAGKMGVLFWSSSSSSHLAQPAAAPRSSP